MSSVFSGYIRYTISVFLKLKVVVIKEIILLKCIRSFKNFKMFLVGSTKPNVFGSMPRFVGIFLGPSMSPEIRAVDLTLVNL